MDLLASPGLGFKDSINTEFGVGDYPTTEAKPAVEDGFFQKKTNQKISRPEVKINVPKKLCAKHSAKINIQRLVAPLLEIVPEEVDSDLYFDLGIAPLQPSIPPLQFARQN